MLVCVHNVCGAAGEATHHQPESGTMHKITERSEPTAQGAQKCRHVLFSLNVAVTKSGASVRII